jgi:hypothetical protein
MKFKLGNSLFQCLFSALALFRTVQKLHGDATAIYIKHLPSDVIHSTMIVSFLLFPSSLPPHLCLRHLHVHLRDFSQT